MAQRGTPAALNGGSGPGNGAAAGPPGQARRSAALRDGVVNFGYAQPFFHDFRRCRARVNTPLGVTTFGTPVDYAVVWDPLAFTALFRHFCYSLGANLELPRGAYFAGSSCLAAITLPAHKGATYAVARLAKIEQRTRERQRSFAPLGLSVPR